MATFKIRDKETGEVFNIREKEAPEKMVGVAGKVPQKAYEQGARNILGNIYERPAAAIRSFLQGKGYTQGAINPSGVPNFQDITLKKYYQKTPDFIGKPLVGNIPSAMGLVADVATNPAELLTMLATSGAIKGAGKTRVGQAIGRFLNKPRRFFPKWGKRAVQDIAEKAHRGSSKVFNQFKDRYESLFNEIKRGTTYADDLIQTLDENISAFPEGASMGKLNKIYKRIGEAKQISAEELQNLKQVVGKTIRWRGKTDAINHARKQVYYKINNALERIGGKKYKGLSREYAEFKGMMEEIDSVILQRGRPTDVKLGAKAGRSLSTPQKEALKALNAKLPSKEQFMHEFAAWQKGQLLKWLAATVGVGGALYGIRRKIGNKLPVIGYGEGD